MSSAKHSYHLVDPSPWPFAAGVSSLVAAFGFISFMHDEGNSLFYLGAAMLMLTAAAWWRDVIREGEVEGHHTPVVQIGLFQTHARQNIHDPYAKSSSSKYRLLQPKRLSA